MVSFSGSSGREGFKGILSPYIGLCRHFGTLCNYCPLTQLHKVLPAGTHCVIHLSAFHRDAANHRINTLWLAAYAAHIAMLIFLAQTNRGVLRDLGFQRVVNRQVAFFSYDTRCVDRQKEEDSVSACLIRVVRIAGNNSAAWA